MFSNTALAASLGCANANALGVGRTVEIDTTGGPGFGFEHYKAYDFLQPKEVVLTFDDGPQKFATEAVLAALAAECTKATFFAIGKMALGYPEILRAVAAGGHTIGSHTWSHKAIAKLKTFEEGRDEIERGVSAVKRAAGAPISPFFRFPTLRDTPESVAHLGTRNMAMFSTDIDSFDFKLQPPEKLVQGVMDKLEKKGKGILLFHDIHKNTARSMPLLLTALKDKGYKVVHLTAKAPVETLAEFDALIEKDAKGLPQAGSERPTSSVVRTIGGEAPAGETPKPEAATPGKSFEVTAPVSAPASEPAAAPQAAVTPGGAATNASPDVASPPEETATPVQEQAAAPAASPVTTAAAPDATSSITCKVGDAGSEAREGEAPAGKSMSEQAKELWEMWFGK
jgi:peptidoglycan-N-acetylglucosamine deacetylase